MPRLATEHTEVVLEAAMALFIRELSILAKLRGQVRHHRSLLLELTRTFGRLPGGIRIGGRVGGGWRHRLGALVSRVRGLVGRGRCNGMYKAWETRSSRLGTEDVKKKREYIPLQPS